MSIDSLIFSRIAIQAKIVNVKAKAAEKPFDRFQRLIRGIVAVPKKEVEAEQERWRADRALKKKPAS
jgi:hypothetical protein